MPELQKAMFDRVLSLVSELQLSFRVQAQLYLCEVTKYLAVKRWEIKITVAADDVTAVDHIYYLDGDRVIRLVLFIIRFFFLTMWKQLILLLPVTNSLQKRTRLPKYPKNARQFCYWVLTDDCRRHRPRHPSRVAAVTEWSIILSLVLSFLRTHTLYTYEL